MEKQKYLAMRILNTEENRLIKADILTPSLELTGRGERLLFSILYTEFPNIKAKLVEIANDIIESRKKDGECGGSDE